MKEGLVGGQARINKLKEDQGKTLKEAFPMIDELDILQKQYEDKEFNQKARMVADDLDYRNIRPDIKADQMHHMRMHLERNGPPDNFDFDQTKNDLQRKINDLKEDYEGGENYDPELRNKMDELENAIKTAVGGQPNAVPPLNLPPVPPPITGFPPMGGLPPLPGGIPPMYGGLPAPFPGGPFHHPLEGMANPTLNYLKSQIERQEQENKKLHEELDVGGGKKGDFNSIAKRAENDIEMLREKLLPNGFGGGTGGHLPDDFEFVQNRFRSEDLETEERALISL